MRFLFGKIRKILKGCPFSKASKAQQRGRKKARRPAHCGAPRFEVCAGRIRLFCVIAVPVLHIVLIELRQTGGRVELVGAAA